MPHVDNLSGVSDLETQCLVGNCRSHGTSIGHSRRPKIIVTRGTLRQMGRYDERIPEADNVLRLSLNTTSSKPQRLISSPPSYTLTVSYDAEPIATTATMIKDCAAFDSRRTCGRAGHDTDRKYRKMGCYDGGNTVEVYLFANASVTNSHHLVHRPTDCL